MCVSRTLSLALTFALLVGFGCTTTVIRDGEEVPYEEPNDAATSLFDPEQAHEARIAATLQGVALDRDERLLRHLQWLVSQKALAVPQIVAALDGANNRTRANLLYVLGFTRTAESTAGLVAHLSEEEPAVRFEAAAGLLNHGDRAAVPVLIDFLQSPDRKMRYKAIEALRLGTGEDFGYRFAEPEELRNASLTKWQDWWTRERDRLMVRPGPKS